MNWDAIGAIGEIVGACAVVVAGVLTGRCDRTATVTLRGGDLEIEYREQDGTVLMKFAVPGYRKRPPFSELVEAIEALQAGS